MEIQTINEFKQLSEELSKYDLFTEEPERLVTVLINMKHCRYEPKKIVAEFSNIKSLKRREKILKDDCQMLKNRISEYRQVLPLLQQIRSIGIGLDKLLPFIIAVNEKARASKLSISMQMIARRRKDGI